MGFFFRWVGYKFHFQTLELYIRSWNLRSKQSGLHQKDLWFLRERKSKSTLGIVRRDLMYIKFCWFFCYLIWKIQNRMCVCVCVCVCVKMALQSCTTYKCPTVQLKMGTASLLTQVILFIGVNDSVWPSIIFKCPENWLSCQVLNSVFFSSDALLRLKNTVFPTIYAFLKWRDSVW